MDIQKQLNCWALQMNDNNPRKVWVVDDKGDAFLKKAARQYHCKWQRELPGDWLYEVIHDCLQFGEESWGGSEPIPFYYNDIAALYGKEYWLINDIFHESGMESIGNISEQIQSCATYLYQDCLEFFNRQAYEFLEEKKHGL